MFDDLNANGKKMFEHPSREEYKRFKQKEHNNRQKRIAKVVGENFATFGLFAVMVLMIGSIWTEFGIFTNWRKFISEALITIVLYILADFYASSLGALGGKLDDDYIKNHDEYLSLREAVRKAGIVLMQVFCDWQIDVEYEYYLRRRCRDLKIDYKEYCEKFSKMSLEELSDMFIHKGEEKPRFTIKHPITSGLAVYRYAKQSDDAKNIFYLRAIQPIKLTPEILMTDGRVRNNRGGVPMSGEEYVEKHTVGPKHIIMTALFAIVAAIPVVELAQEFSLAMLVYTIFKIALMLYRMYSGYSRGAKGFNSIDPLRLQGQIHYLNLYMEFLNKKIYLSLKDKYTLVGTSDAEDKREEQVDQAGA